MSASLLSTNTAATAKDNENNSNDNKQGGEPPCYTPTMDLELVAEMFGGIDKLWDAKKLGRIPPGWSLYLLAARKLSSRLPLPAGAADTMTPREVLLSRGVVENSITKKLFQYADRETLVPGLSVENVAMKLIDSFRTSSAYRGELDDLAENRVYNFGGNGNRSGPAAAQFFPVSFAGENGQDGIDDDEKARLVLAVQDWLGPVPTGHVRLCHGTDAVAAENIVLYGVDSGEFEKNSDFGHGFYCSKKIGTGFEYGRKQGISCERPGRRGAIMTFDVPSQTYEASKKFEFNDVERWKSIVRAWYDRVQPGPKHVFVDAAVVVGYISDATKGYKNPKPIVDEMQYVFRLDHGNMLLEDRTKVKVAVFDVVDDSDDEDCGDH